MLKVISKHIEARVPGGQLLEDDYFNRIRQNLKFDTGYERKEDYGIQRQKKTINPGTEFGSNDRGHNPGAGMGLGRDPNESKDKSLSSGYNDGEQADDEVGPGYTPTVQDPYSKLTNELFVDLEIKNQGNRDSIKGHVDKIINGPAVVKPHKRYSVK